MNESRNVLLTTLSSISRVKCSGIKVANNLIITFAASLNRVLNIHGDGKIFRFVRNTTEGKIIALPKEIRVECRVISCGTNGEMFDSKGSIVALWKCPCLIETFNKSFQGWTFHDYNSNCTMAVIYLIQFNEIRHLDIVTIENILFKFSEDQIFYKLERGSNVEIEPMNLENVDFSDTSSSHGIVCNTVGIEGCIIVTDVEAFTSYEGGPLYAYTCSTSTTRIVYGMVITASAWHGQEFMGYTLAANLAFCLRKVFDKSTLSPRRIESSSNIIIESERNVVIVRCGVYWGTGIVLDQNTGTILTCAHVIKEGLDGDIRIATRLNKSDSWPSIKAKLVYKTPKGVPYDVAVLRVDSNQLNPSLKSVKFAQTPPYEGETVIVIGFPNIASNKATVSRGIISKTTDCMFQTTCCVQSGISGGPVVRIDNGEMIGMLVCNAISSNQSIVHPRLNLSIPVTILNDPLQRFLWSKDMKDLESFENQDLRIQAIWDFKEFLPSKM